MGVSSLQRGGQHFDAGRLLPPLDPAWENFERLFSENGFGRLFVNSVVVTAAAVGVGTLAAVFGAYAFTRIRTRAAGALFNMTVACLAIPPIVVLVPLFLLAADAGLINNMLAPIVIYVGFIMPFSILLLKNFFDEIPRELLQAARVEGASPVQELWHVILPLSRAPLVALGVVNALWVWNELLISIVFLRTSSSGRCRRGSPSSPGRNVVDIPMTMAGFARGHRCRSCSRSSSASATSCAASPEVRSNSELDHRPDAVTKVYANGVCAVDAVDLTVGAGEFVVPRRSVGCGKSTLLRMVAGLEELTAGRIHIGGADVSEMPPKHRDIAMVFQSYALLPAHDRRGQHRLRAAHAARRQGRESSARAGRRAHPRAHAPARPPSRRPVGRPAPARGDGDARSCATRGPSSWTTAVEPRRPAARRDARRAQAGPRAREGHDPVRDARPVERSPWATASRCCETACCSNARPRATSSPVPRTSSSRRSSGRRR
jgi:ABC-type glycerol-3-phosphate transport system permease component